MSLLLLFNDDGGGGTPVPTGGLDCLIDTLWVGVEAEIETQTGAFAVIPSLAAMAQITGHSELSADVELLPLACSAFMRSICVIDCVATMPAIGGHMTASTAPAVDASVLLPCVTALAEMYRGGAVLSVSIFIPCVQVSALIADASAYDFGAETDSILRYETSRRLI